jgi:Tol biopolymer transport system component
MAANGVGEQENLVDGVSAPTDWSLDGRFLLFWRRGEKTRTDIWALPLFGERKPYPLLNSPANEELARFSPDGHWLAYTSDESGSQEVYVRSFTSEGRARRGPEAHFITGRLATDVSPDGQRFLIGELTGEATNANPAVILNWTATLRK